MKLARLAVSAILVLTIAGSLIYLGARLTGTPTYTFAILIGDQKYSTRANRVELRGDCALFWLNGELDSLVCPDMVTMIVVKGEKK